MTVRLLGAVAILIIAGAFANLGSADQATPTPGATPFVCPVTQPNDVTPPSEANVFGRDAGGYGNEYLWTSLWTWGEGGIALPEHDPHVTTDGGLMELKWPWFRFVNGTLTITGHRLDGDSPPLEVLISDGYGSYGFTPSGITFPRTGCWEVTGHIGDGSLTFITEVRIIAAAAPVATPK